MKSIKITDNNGQKVSYFGMSPDKFDELAELIQKVLAQKAYAIVCITGNKGVGKTTLGKLIRKKGFGPFKPKEIAMIDDDCMSVDTLFFFRRKYVSPCQEVDELHPFFRYCPKKPDQVLCQVKPRIANHASRCSSEVCIGEERGGSALIQRYGEQKGERVFRQTQSMQKIPTIEFRYRLSAQIQ